MKKRAELLKVVNGLRKTVVDLMAAGKYDEAKTASDDLAAKLDELETLQETPATSNNLKPISNLGGMTNMNTKEKRLQVHAAVNQYLRRGWQGMDAEAKTLIKPVDSTDTPGQVEAVDNRGGVLVPVETADYVVRQATGNYRLRTRVQEHFPASKAGKIPLLNNPTAGLVAQFDEFPSAGINKGQVQFGAVNYTVKDYGLIVPVSNDLLRDASVDVFAEIMEQFMRAQVVTENTMILAAIDSAVAQVTEITDWKGITKALNKTTPIGNPDKVIITNSDGYNWLDTLTDTVGHPILTQALVDNPKRMFRGYEVIQLPDETLPTATPEADHDYGAIPFYVGSLYDAVMFVERQGLEVMYNPYADSAFSKNATDVRVTCRLDAKSKFASAMQKLTYTPANDD